MEVIMEEILTRLPPKSMMRFKSVSKEWSSLIRSSYFNNRFLLKVPSSRTRRLYISLVDLKDYRNSVTLSLSATSSSSLMVDHDLTILQMGASITQNLCGFMCYTFRNEPQIYNPTTRQLITLPVAIKSSDMVSAPGESRRAGYCYFGHDPVNNHYKVICSTSVRLLQLREIRSEHKVFVLKRGGGGDRGCWRKATLPPDVLPHVPAHKGGVCVDAVIYYMGWIYDDYILVSFNIRSRDFQMFQVPRREADLEHRLIDLTNVSRIEYDGKLTMLDQTHLIDKAMLDLWILEDAGNKIWSRKTLKLQPSQLHLLVNNNNNSTFDIRGTTQNGKIFFIPQSLLSDPYHILSYDLQTNDMRKIEIKGVPEHWFSQDQSKLNVIVMDQGVTLENLDTST